MSVVDPKSDQPSPQSSPSAPDFDLTDRTVLVLGASNVSLAWSPIVNHALRLSKGRIKLLTAFGMGRAYVSSQSGFAAHRLPGILHCGIWRSLPEFATDATPRALLTDFGNDLLYGRSAEEISNGANECIHRLRAWQPKVDLVITRPPLESVQTLKPARFRLFRQLLFPFCRLSLQQVASAAGELTERLETLAQEQQLKLFHPQPDWFGFDPIHIRRNQRSVAIASMMNLWDLPPGPAEVSGRWRKPTPELRSVLGRQRHCQQPALLRDRIQIYSF